jgi:hypothetical protein
MVEGNIRANRALGTFPPERRPGDYSRAGSRGAATIGLGRRLPAWPRQSQDQAREATREAQNTFPSRGCGRSKRCVHRSGPARCDIDQRTFRRVPCVADGCCTGGHPASQTDAEGVSNYVLTVIIWMSDLFSSSGGCSTSIAPAVRGPRLRTGLASSRWRR